MLLFVLVAILFTTMPDPAYPIPMGGVAGMPQNLTVTPIQGSGGCPKNEIYIVDGDKTLMVTSRKIITDMDYVQDETLNLRSQVKNLNQVIETLKQRLRTVEAQSEEQERRREARDKSHLVLVRQLNDTLGVLDSVAEENRVLVKQRDEERAKRIHTEAVVLKIKDQVNEMAQELMELSKVANDNEDSKREEARVKQCQTKLIGKDVIINTLSHDLKVANDLLEECKKKSGFSISTEKYLECR